MTPFVIQAFCSGLRRVIARHLHLITVCGALCLATGCVSTEENSKRSTPNAIRGHTYYTQFSLFYEGHTHRTTNYRKGILVPINSAVTFVKSRQQEIIVKLPDGQELTIENIQKFSGENIVGIFNRTLSTNRVSLSGFSQDEQDSILNGTVEIGMTKAAVVFALGYPPKHRTPSLNSNEWRYWQNRFKTFVVHFTKGRVSQIQK